MKSEKNLFKERGGGKHECLQHFLNGIFGNVECRGIGAWFRSL
jgi:hypothetical protein